MREGLYLCLFVTLLTFVLDSSRADLSSSPEFQDALQSLSQGEPSLGVQKLEFLLNKNDPSLSGSDKEQITLLLLEAQVRSKNHKQALALIAQYPALQQTKIGQFWNAMALVENGQLSKATPTLKELNLDLESPYQNWATLTLSRISAQQNELEIAINILQPLLASDKPAIVTRAQLTGAEIYLQNGLVQEAQTILNLHPIEHQLAPNQINFLRARIAMLQSNFPKAISYLEQLRKTEELAFKDIHQEATLLLGDAYLANGQKQEAITHWLHLIKHRPNDNFLPQTFEKLDKIGAFTIPEISQNLAQWSEEETAHAQRQAYSQYYFALTQIQLGFTANAQKNLEAFLLIHPDHPLYTTATLALAQLLISQGNIPQTRSLLLKLKQAALAPTNRSKALYLDALTDFKQGDFVNAENKFLESSKILGNAESSEDGTFNVALTALYANDQTTFIQYQDLLSQSKNTDLQAKLLLEQGLYQASRSATQSFDTLSLFLEKFPQHSRAADAHFALAELYLNEIPAKPVSAREHLKLASENQLIPAQKEALDYIAVWIEEIDGNFSAAIEQALIYLDHWPQSLRAPEIRLKLGGAYYRDKDYSQAAVALEQLAVNHPESSLYGAALFSAGKAASLSTQSEDRAKAIEFWARLAKNSEDPLALFARHEQGLYKLKLDEFDDAITAFESILNSPTPLPLELKLAVLADRGQAMFSFATARDDDAALLENALRSFDSILSEPKASSAWRNQAAVRKAKCLERLDRNDEALNT